MIIILQGKDLLKYHPITGKPINKRYINTQIIADGREIIMLGDCGKKITEDEMIKSENEVITYE